MLLPLAIACLICAAIPALLTLLNLREYKAPQAAVTTLLPAVTVIIPARNEAEGIEACIRSVLASTDIELRAIIVDDNSTDSTPSIVKAIADQDTRVTLLQAPALPAGWNGKQHACHIGAAAATTPLLLFLDADVRLQPAAIQSMTSQLLREQVALVSGFPKELTGTLFEKLLLPLIHFILLGLLPMRFMRTSMRPGYAAGCGQFLLVDRTAYEKSGGHTAIRDTMHDGLLLPRLLRQHGYGTRLYDLTDLAECRMYRGAAQTWNGLAKNATEGIAAPARILPMTLLLGLGQVLPLPLLWIAWHHTSFIIPFLGPPVRIGMTPVWLALAAAALSYLPRLINTVRYRQSPIGAILHPIGVATLLALQWYALVRRLLGKPATWRSRSYPS